MPGRGSTAFGSQKVRREQCRPERRSARSINVCERTDEPWRLPAEVMCRVQREKTWYSGQRGCILWPCQGQNGNPGQYEGLGGQYFWLWYVKPTAEGGPPREGQSEIELLLHQAELLHAELELNSRMLEELEARFIGTTKKLALEELHTELIETTQRLESELNDRTRWAKRLDAELERAHAQLQALYGSVAYRIGRRLRLAPDPPPTPNTLAESRESKEISHQDDESNPSD